MVASVLWRRGWLAVAIALVWASQPARAWQEAAQDPPFSKRGLIGFLQKLCASERPAQVRVIQRNIVIPRIVRRGVNFPLRPWDEAEMVSACATQELLAAVREHNRCPEQDIPLGGPIEGELSAECPAAEYRLEVPCIGALAVEANAPGSVLALELFDQRGEKAAEGTALHATVRPGSYYLSVRAANEGRGPFQLQTSFACPMRQIGQAEEKVDRIDREDCRSSTCGVEAVPAAFGEACLHLYKLRVAERGKLILDLVSSEFDPYLFLLDSSSVMIGEDDNAGGGTNARLLTGPLPLGDYTVLAAAPKQGGGTYRLQTRFAARPCAVWTIKLNADAQRAIGSDDCRRSDLFPSSTDGTSLVHEYRFQVERPGPVTLDLSSGEFDSYLLLVDSNGAPVAEDDSGGGKRNPQIQRSLKPGAYRALVMARGGATGAYRFQARQGCAVNEIPLNAVVVETLSEADCEAPGGSPMDLYRLTANAATRLSLEIEAAGFAPYLMLLHNDGNRIAGRPGSRLESSGALTAGVYLVAVTSISRAAGSYRLRVSSREPPCAVKEITVGASATGRFAGQDCHLKDAAVNAAGDQYVQAYQMRVPYRGELTLSLASADFDPELLLYDGRYNRPRDKNTWRWAGNVRGVWDLDPGDYLIMVTSRGMSAGDYTVQTAFVPQRQ